VRGEGRTRRGYGSKSLAVMTVAALSACASATGPHPAPSTSAVPTTAAPETSSSTSTTVGVSARDQVINSHAAYVTVFDACAANPSTCDTSSVIISGSPAAAGVSAYMAQLAKGGLRGRPSPQTYYVYEDFSLANTGTQAVLRICTVDAGVTYDPHGGPQGQEVIVNDRVDSDLSDWTYRRDADSWKLYSTTVINQWKGSNGCPPRPSA